MIVRSCIALVVAMIVGVGAQAQELKQATPNVRKAKQGDVDILNANPALKAELDKMLPIKLAIGDECIIFVPKDSVKGPPQPIPVSQWSFPLPYYSFLVWNTVRLFSDSQLIHYYSPDQAIYAAPIQRWTSTRYDREAVMSLEFAPAYPSETKISNNRQMYLFLPDNAPAKKTYMNAGDNGYTIRSYSFPQKGYEQQALNTTCFKDYNSSEECMCVGTRNATNQAARLLTPESIQSDAAEHETNF